MMFKNFTDDLRVVDIKLTGPTGNEKSIVSQVLALQIQEDVTAPYVVAEISIGDAIGLLQSFPIRGEETIELQFTSPQLNDVVLRYKLWVYGVSHVSSGLKNDVNVYQLKCISEEMMLNASRLVTKGYKDTFSSVVDDIVKTQLGSNKPIKAASTSGVQDWVVPSLKPFQAIDMIRRRATSTTHAYSPMLFFETQDGFVFDSITSLYEKGVKQGGDDGKLIEFVFTNATLNETDRSGVIMAFNAPEKRDTFQQVNNGTFNNKVTTYDIITKTLKTYDFNYKEKQSSFEFFNDPVTHSDAFINKWGEATSRSYLIPIDSTKPNPFVDRVGDKQAYASVMFQNLSKVQLVGSKNNKLLRAGGVVLLSFPAEMISYKGKESQEQKDSQNSGYYFIKRVVHDISLISSPPTYVASCELVAGSSMEKV